MMFLRKAQSPSSAAGKAGSLATLSLAPMAAGTLTASIFVVDTVTNLEIAVAVFYVAVVLMSVRFCRRRGVLLVSAGCMVLTLLSHFLTPEGEPRAGLINCVISILAIGATTYLALQIASAQVAVHEARTQLTHIARVTTLGELTASIAHEVNQPLGAVVTNGNACLRWLAGEPPNLTEAKQAVERIIDDANRASEVVWRVRGLARRDAPERGPLNINDIVSEIVELTRSEIHRSNIALRTQFTTGLPPVLGDRIQLQQVVLNLILNAIDAINATVDGQRQLTVSTEKDEAGGGIRVTVSDSGLGLNPDNLDHIFDAFYTTKPAGMGMGLTISRSIVEAHGGRLRALPEVSRGAAFQFTLPPAREGDTGAAIPSRLVPLGSRNV